VTNCDTELQSSFLKTAFSSHLLCRASNRGSQVSTSRPRSNAGQRRRSEHVKKQTEVKPVTINPMQHRMKSLRLILLIAVWVAVAAVADEDTGDGDGDSGFFSTTCGGGPANSCEDCVSRNNLTCGWVSAGNICLVDCQYIADVPCYSSATIDTATTARDICLVLEREQNNTILCAAAADCSSCVSTLLSDGETNCQWYPPTESCGTGACNILGCGETTCVNEEGDGNGGAGVLLPMCEGVAACESCLRLECAWVPSVGSCRGSCDDNSTDVACYSSDLFQGTEEEICTTAANDEADQKLCSNQTDCVTCTSTTKSDQSSSCKWYDNGVNSWCGTGGCDPSGENCGSSSCRTGSPTDAPVEEPTDPSTTTNAPSTSTPIEQPTNSPTPPLEGTLEPTTDPMQSFGNLTHAGEPLANKTETEPATAPFFSTANESPVNNTDPPVSVDPTDPPSTPSSALYHQTTMLHFIVQSFGCAVILLC